MEEKQLMDFDVLTLGEGETADEDLQILFVLNGTVSVQTRLRKTKAGNTVPTTG